MKRVTKIGVALMGVLLLASAAQAGWWDDVGTAKPVDLDDVIKNPQAYKGKEIAFECVFHKVSTFYNPYYTRFVPTQYLNFAVWPTTRKLWKKADYENGLPFLFLEKDHKAYTQILGMEKYTRVRFVGYVQNTFKNSPWIEIRHVKVLDSSLTQSSLREIILGDKAVAAAKFDVALSHYAAALEMTLPESVVASVETKRGMAYHRQKNYPMARESFMRALSLSPDSSQAKFELAKVNEEFAKAASRPAVAEKLAPVEAKAIDPKRYLPAPMALPVPVETGKEEPAAVPADEPVAPERSNSVVLPVEPAAATEAPAAVQPEAPAEPAAPAAAPAPAEEEKKKPEVEKGPNPKKRLSGPM